MKCFKKASQWHSQIANRCQISSN